MENTELTGRRNRKQKKSKKNKKLKIAIIIILIIVVVAAAAGFLYLYAEKVVTDNLKKFDYVSLENEDLDIDSKAAENLKGYQNIVLLGIDTREGEDDDACRSDAVIVASINRETYEVKLTSILRDSYLDLEESGQHVFDKLTHAHAYGGPVNTIRALNRNLDLNVDNYIRVNWRTVADVVDAFGGIEVTIKEYEIDEMNKYIKDTNKNLKGDQTEIKKAGKQTLNGVQAVTYCRIRKVGNGDTERAERMRKTINAIVQRATKMELSKLSKIADKVLPEVQTSINPHDMFGLMKNYLKYEFTDSTTWPYDFDGAQLANSYGQMIWYDVPITLESNVKKLHTKVFDQKDYTPSDRILEFSRQIAAATGFYGNDSTSNYQ